MNKYVSQSLASGLSGREAILQLTEFLVVAPSREVMAVREAIAYFRGRMSLSIPRIATQRLVAALA